MYHDLHFTGFHQLHTISCLIIPSSIIILLNMQPTTACSGTSHQQYMLSIYTRYICTMILLPLQFEINLLSLYCYTTIRYMCSIFRKYYKITHSHPLHGFSSAVRDTIARAEFLKDGTM